MSGPSPVHGIHAVTALVERDGGSVQRILVEHGRRNRRLEALLRFARERGIEVVPAGRAELDRLSGYGRHQGVVAEAWPRRSPETPADTTELLDSLDHDPLLLVLDGVQDPHNLGACLRSAAAAGADAVIVPADRACGVTPAVRHVASGGAELVPVITVTNLARELAALAARGIWVVGATGDGDDDLYDIDLSGPLAIVVGAEERGLRRLTREHCDRLLRIPMPGAMESLNVSVAAGVFLFEVVRQRLARAG